jgi:O-acetyl-ADP-ribose deacetylase (regulator of RNase III)
MIFFTQGNLVTSHLDAITNTVNCVGVMGKGLALQFKTHHPDNFQAYAKACSQGLVRPGKMFIFSTGKPAPRFIVNFPTKRHWRDGSRLEDIASGLKALKEDIVELGVTSIGIPPLGCGCGGLDWAVVREMIEEELTELDCMVSVFGEGPARSPSFE